MNIMTSFCKACLLTLLVWQASATQTTVYAQVASAVVGIPAPFGGELGQIGAGLAFQSRTRNTEKGWNPDGNAAVAAGLGDSKKWVGVMLNANIFGLSNRVGEDNNFGSGTLDVQINRNINDYIFVGAGVRNLFKWRVPEVAPPRNNLSYFATTSFIIPIHRRYDEPFSLLFLTGGIGNGIFRLERDFDPETSGNFNVFGSAALQVLRGTNVIVEWNGLEITTGLSIYPFKKLPSLGGIIAITDWTEERTRIIGSIGYFLNINQRRAAP